MNEITLKTLSLTIDGLVQKQEVELTKSAQLALKNNFLILNEMKTKNGSSILELIKNSDNTKITATKILQNSLLNLEYNRDFWVLPFKNGLTEIKNGYAWKSIAMQFSIQPIKQLRVCVIFKGDNFEFNNGLDQTFNWIPNNEIDRTDYNNILMAVGIVKYQNGDIDMLSVSKNELDKIKAKSPSGNSDFSPWKQFPLKMVEGKVMRDLVKRIIDLDRNKIISQGIKLSDIDDEKVYEVKNNKIVEKTYNEVQKDISIQNGYLERQKDNYKVEIGEVVKDEDISDFELTPEQQEIINRNQSDLAEEELE